MQQGSPGTGVEKQLYGASIRPRSHLHLDRFAVPDQIAGNPWDLEKQRTRRGFRIRTDGCPAGKAGRQALDFPDDRIGNAGNPAVRLGLYLRFRHRRPKLVLRRDTARQHTRAIAAAAWLACLGMECPEGRNGRICPRRLWSNKVGHGWYNDCGRGA